MLVAVSSVLTSAAEFSTSTMFMAFLSHLPMPSPLMASPPFSIEDVPFAAVHMPVVMGNTVYRAGNEAALHDPPRPVVGP